MILVIGKGRCYSFYNGYLTQSFNGLTGTGAWENSRKSSVAQASKLIEMRKLTLADSFMATLAVGIEIGYPVARWIFEMFLRHSRLS